MRCRTEDLGRIAVMLDNMLEHPLFSEDRMRPKDFPDWFIQQSEDKKDDILRGFSYGLEALEEAIYNIREIARGEDRLNVVTEE